ncbi:hypothetical protein [Flammeovirga kamogawensis]|uniref:Uncharacterized protein n=1 Tax=Flammeovirga kamogawensis TaxID=373891 RepID=A0ABX8GUK4_9BACT|nr:hypothetical protein [Flammeovirga kamogawensis]MBB6459668.1 hypothetical protein [Flammeovirga kamogawensis]QWG07270.1 hypothetical protein KM029_18500 [Flammeovirga kamogawensis]TRX69090.1 hypothetical protein EO216_13490 [Flammeovirga kamogawensis]
MKKVISVFVLFISSLSVFPQEISHFNLIYDVRFDSYTSINSGETDNKFQFDHVFLGVYGAVSDQVNYTL